MSPLSLVRRGGIGYERKASPLFGSPCSGVIIKGVLEGRSPSKEIIFPFPLSRGRGYRGWG